ncbi:type I polyketide synthase [Nocardiopsis changdeensis]|uniref:SDR family NAD(P)-dependent oxidoreductase n=1 Tax=Nocardiopsis changdeensis TaxID=2831969 RepID=A0ABX8BRF5_9ACTN|nr:MULTISPECIES: type I polyketide synthase [Nocardiopsis]QUX24827.1 SDR family NAD(P)-dependent oxidoreductase [Nocardiopsis changdeensis]QYX35213.1 SDR family NAD(P)-dependent oxidoreductase [Nocardiopsis sp. MT53]
MDRIAITGMACRYPDADSTEQLWENVLAGRRAFRRIPAERLSLADYWSADPTDVDRFHSDRAAVLRGFEFDRSAYRVAGSTFRSTDMTHWLALDTAARALADAGFPEGRGLPRATTGVVLGNTLTGEFSRANSLRLRWPYVRRTLADVLRRRGRDGDEVASLLAEAERAYKEPLPAPDEDTLAGGLSNTIAGRVCNHFDLGGGGHTVDGACASSLLAVVTAARALVAGDLDVALVGGVDLSLDPFELVGFARTGALATGDMRVYDRDSNGFWPGEGAGVVVLMREEDALASGARVYALVTGWAVSSDGAGGITRPEQDGHRTALERAYARAGYSPATVGYFEGHGTGTALGDATEIAALSAARGPGAPSALGSIKANIGHTKAAAGVAGLIKAALAVHHRVVPPGTAQHTPHPLLTGPDAVLRVPERAEPWPQEGPARAGVSAMGFGGINTHIALQACGTPAPAGPDERTRLLVAGRQDAELLLADAEDPAALRSLLASWGELLPGLSHAELTDLAAAAAAGLGGGAVRCAVVAADPQAAAHAVAELVARIDAGEEEVLAPEKGIFLSGRPGTPAITFLMPGQGTGEGARGALRRRFPHLERTLDAAAVPEHGDPVATENAQPRIVAGSLAALKLLDGLGVTARAAVGHSLGELTALHWAGALGEEALLELARARGGVMARTARAGGAMLHIAADAAHAARLAAADPDPDVVVAAHNGPGQTIVSGPSDAVARVRGRARAQGLDTALLQVSHAFHSPLVAPAVPELRRVLGGIPFAPPARRVVSTVDGADLGPGAPLPDLLCDQVVRPVLFLEAVSRVAPDTDLFLEAGPGRVLSRAAARIAPGVPALSVDTDAPTLVPLLKALGAAFALGAPVDGRKLFEGRLVRPLPAAGGFLANPCETAPAGLPGDASARLEPAPGPGASPSAADEEGADTLALLRRRVAERVELPPETVTEHTRPLDELHLSSITVGQIANEVARARGLPPLEATSGHATSSLAELAALIDDPARAADGRPTEEVAGAGPWVRAFGLRHRPAAAPAPVTAGASPSHWTVHAPDGDRRAGRVRAALAAAGAGEGVLLMADPDRPADSLAAAQEAADRGVRLVVLQSEPVVSGLARTLHVEAGVPVTVIESDTAPDGSDTAPPAAVVAAEAAATTAYTEVRYTGEGRTVPALVPLVPGRPGSGGAAPLGPDDVVLVTGGGKGITAECARDLALRHGPGLLLLGRSDPGTDPELAANLERLADSGVRYRYERADAADPDQVRAAVGRAAGLGAVTAVLHGAGRNEPAPLGALTPADLAAAAAPKVDGLHAVLAAVDPRRLRLLVTFGSVIGRAGLRGEAHYAAANDRMSALAREYGRRHPHTRVLALEWSVWSGAGMGERMGVVESLLGAGVTPISVDEGLEVLHDLLGDPSAGPVVVVCGRMGDPPTLPAPGPLPLGRFLERIRVHCAGTELVTDTELSLADDPYLEDHRFDGDMLVPAVIGMEAMAQVGTAIAGYAGLPDFEDVEFLRPIVVPPSGTCVVRVAALVRDTGTVDVVVRTGETGFAADHFRAVLRLPPAGRPPAERSVPATDAPHVPLDPTAELYGGLFFQGKRFQRLSSYRRVSARHTVAEVTGDAGGLLWFAPYLPQGLVLADPGVRDTAMHALQAGVPDAVLLPERVDRLLPAPPDRSGPFLLAAAERFRDGDSHVYDVELSGPDGLVVERWEGLRLRAVRSRGGAAPWPAPLLGPHLERSVSRFLGEGVRVAAEPAAGPGRAQAGAAALRRCLDRAATVRHRPDGRPEVDGAHVSVSHGAGAALAVCADTPVGCDIEEVVRRDRAAWADLLGPGPLAAADLAAREAGEDADTSATRVWAVLECLRKLGTATSGVVLERVRPGGWAVFASGAVSVATLATGLAGRDAPVVVAVGRVPGATSPKEQQ